MDESTIIGYIVTALAGYVSEDAKALTDKMGQKAYAKCKVLVKTVWDRLSGNPKNEMVIEEFKDSPEDYEKPLTRKLEQACEDKKELFDELRALFQDYQQEKKTYAATIEGDEGVISQASDAKIAPHGIATDDINTDGGDVVVGTKIVHKHESDDPETKKTQNAHQRYFTRLYRFCQALPLEPLGGGDQEITLDQLYINLNTTSGSGEYKKLLKKRGRVTQTQSLSALDALVCCKRMVLLGNPGSGKSTFAKKMLAAYAGKEIGKVQEMPEGLEAGLLPVWVSLRNLASRLKGLDRAEQEKLDDKERVSKFCGFLRQQLEDEGDLDFWEEIHTILLSGKSVLVFDGLDEVPEVYRKYVRQMIIAVLKSCDPQRVLLTCRIRSYHGQAMLKGFAMFTLAALNPTQMNSFCTAWYEALFQSQQVSGKDKLLKSENLIRVIHDSPDLTELADNPMLLTTMAVIHQKETELPGERVKLYKLAVDVLLRRWQRHHQHPGMRPSDSLMEVLGNDEKILGIMEMLAYETHKAAGGDTKKQADLERKEALSLLEGKKYLGSAGLAEEFLDYVDQRSGLFIGLGGGGEEGGKPGTYIFPHRTFQEYLAGCFMVSGRDADIGRRFETHVKEGDYWYVAAQFGAEELYHNRRDKESLFELAYRLGVDIQGEGESGELHRKILWSGYIASVAGMEIIREDAVQANHRPQYPNLIRERLLSVMQAERLPPVERAEAGCVLACLGDPRKEVLDSGAMTFCCIEKGVFWFGQGEKAYRHKELDYDYWLAKYPVTVSQYRQFSEAGGYQSEQYWPEAKKAGYWMSGQFKGNYEKEYREGMPKLSGRFIYANNPMVIVSWYESIAYCRWLTSQWLAGKIVSESIAHLRPREWSFVLPSGRQWEKAARGPKDQHPFPLGEELAPNLANYGKAGIGSTSAVGCFVQDKSPYNCMDMTGNVWEWCFNIYTPDGSDRVFRGGNWLNPAFRCRCSYRSRHDPNFCRNNLGFRVALVPTSVSSGR
ncbi:MAG: SUMF1/EgtB/PvdO family nonheme iron enzyme [Phycisphaeraceae bacterium]|nr:SUMF1/EgtB/PvdO family nonheme iron enzyme [Phycisphaeraceae bacterium]